MLRPLMLLRNFSEFGMRTLINAYLDICPFARYHLASNSSPISSATARTRASDATSA
jgi:hypothetical protein